MKKLISTFILFNKKRKVRSMIRNLVRELSNKHGKSRFYTYQKVDAVFEDNYFDDTYIRYAIAFLCNSKNFSIFCGKANINYDYKLLRREVLTLVNRNEFNQIKNTESNSTDNIDLDMSNSNDE